MVFSDQDIRKAIEAGRIVIDPYDDSCVQPASVDLHLGGKFRVFQNHRFQAIDPTQEMEGLTEEYTVDPLTPFILHQGEFALGMTEEEITLPDDIVGRLDGKSSLGRLGLVVHSTAGFVDPGWRGRLTLELSNLANLPINLTQGMKVSQISFMQLSSPAERPYGARALRSKYQGQMGPAASRFYENYHRLSTSRADGRRASPPTAEVLRQWLADSRYQGSVALLASALGVRQKTVEGWVYGRTAPSSRHWARLYQETGLPDFARHQQELQEGPEL